MSRKEDLKYKKDRQRCINYLRKLCRNCTVIDLEGKPIIKPFRYRFRQEGTENAERRKAWRQYSDA